MSTFVNTVDSVGDQALTASIIDKSITELHCNLTASIRPHAFRACTALTNVNFPSVTSVAMGAFWNCTALTKADFASCVSLANNAFYGCSALSAVILRNIEAVSTITGTPFANSAIASGTGYIYVPSALVETYKTNWATYATQIRAIEDYPEVCDLYNWATVFKTIDNGTYKDYYKVGDLVPLDLGSEGLVNMQIAAFDVDDLADGSGTAPISWISKELLATKRRMNPALVTNDDGTYLEGTGNTGGWGSSEMRTYLQETVKPLIHDAVRNRMLAVVKTHITHDELGAVGTQTSEDDVWLVSREELNASKYGIFNTTESKRKKRVIRPQYEGYISWWTREAARFDNTEFYFVGGTGNNNNFLSAHDECGIALCFCT